MGVDRLTTVTRRFYFQAVHSLTKGSHCENTHGHGYFLEITARDIAPIELDKAYRDRIEPHVHARRLLKELEPSTGEHLVDWIHDRLNETHLKKNILAVALQETYKNRFVSAQTERRFV